jgi:hypothetical protein
MAVVRADDTPPPVTVEASPLVKTVASVPIAAALRRAFKKGYRAADLRADLMAGAVVGVVALPLSMALAIAVGAPPQQGLYTAIVAGAVIALLGGCKFQVSGPTAAFVVILAPIVTKHGISGLMTAGFMAGLILVGMGIPITTSRRCSHCGERAALRTWSSSSSPASHSLSW